MDETNVKISMISQLNDLTSDAYLSFIVSNDPDFKKSITITCKKSGEDISLFLSQRNGNEETEITKASEASKIVKSFDAEIKKNKLVCSVDTGKIWAAGKAEYDLSGRVYFGSRKDDRGKTPQHRGQNIFPFQEKSNFSTHLNKTPKTSKI